jgi:hypothetical protein
MAAAIAVQQAQAAPGVDTLGQAVDQAELAEHTVVAAALADIAVAVDLVRHRLAVLVVAEAVVVLAVKILLHLHSMAVAAELDYMD